MHTCLLNVQMRAASGTSLLDILSAPSLTSPSHYGTLNGSSTGQPDAKGASRASMQRPLAFATSMTIWTSVQSASSGANGGRQQLSLISVRFFQAEET